MALARPPANVMRRALVSDLKKHVIIAGVLSTVAALSYKFFVNDWRKAKYQEFYKNYDEERHFQRMAQANVFHSVKPDAESPQWVKDYESEVDKAIAALKK